tara:strand:- start:31 stop:216 length:186 start_codon:yes stop_codon:yes gene_type:complete
MNYSVYNKNYKINHSNKHEFIMAIDKDIKHGKILIHKKDLDVLLDNAFKSLMKSKLKLVKK